jgi:hypothetical protein
MRGAEPLALENVPFLDAGPLGDPLVAGLDHLSELGIGEHVGRHMAENPGNRGTDRGLPDRSLSFAHAECFGVTVLNWWDECGLAG